MASTAAFKEFILLLAEIEPEFVTDVGGQQELEDAIDALGPRVVGVSIYDDLLELTDLFLDDDLNDIPLPFDASGFEITSDGDYDLTGFQAEPHGKMWVLYNVSDKTLRLTHNDSNSLNIDRIFCPDETNFDLHPYQAIYVRYDSNLDGGTGKWHIISL